MASLPRFWPWVDSLCFAWFEFSSFLVFLCLHRWYFSGKLGGYRRKLQAGTILNRKSVHWLKSSRIPRHNLCILVLLKVANLACCFLYSNPFLSLQLIYASHICVCLSFKCIWFQGVLTIQSMWPYSTTWRCFFSSDQTRARILLLLFNSNFSPFMIIKCQLPRTRDGKALYCVPGGSWNKRLGNLYF